MKVTMAQTERNWENEIDFQIDSTAGRLAQPGESSPAGVAVRLLGTLLWPSETFESINRRPTWLVAIIIATSVMIFGNLFFNRRVNPDWEGLTRARIMERTQSSGAQLPPDEIERQVAISKTVAGYFTVSPVILIPATCFALAAIFTLGFKLLSHTEVSFRKILSVVAWSSAATKLAATILLSTILLARNRESLEGFDPARSSLLLSNPASVLPGDASAAVKSLFSSLDIITIWYLILLTIGFAAIAGTRKIRTAQVFTLVFGLWAVWVCVKVGLAGMLG
jgi:hypothetical protein